MNDSFVTNDRYKYVLNLRINNFLYQHKNYFTPIRCYQQTFVDFLQKYWRIIKYKEVEYFNFLIQTCISEGLRLLLSQG